MPSIECPASEYYKTRYNLPLTMASSLLPDATNQKRNNKQPQKPRGVPTGNPQNNPVRQMGTGNHPVHRRNRAKTLPILYRNAAYS